MHILVPPLRQRPSNQRIHPIFYDVVHDLIYPRVKTVASAVHLYFLVK